VNRLSIIKKELSVKEKKEKTLKLSVREGSANSVMVGTSNSFITPFALALGSSSFQIGFLSSISSIIGPLFQLSSRHLMEKTTRKRIVLVTVLLQALMWIPIILLGAMYYFGFWMNFLPILLIIFYALLIGFGAVAYPSWFSWMGDLVPENQRGKYFSRRNKITGAVLIVSMIIAGFALDYFKTKGIVLVGFTILFSIGLFVRLYSLLLLKKHYLPELKLKKGYYISFTQFLKLIPKTNFGRFTLYIGVIHIAVMISSPFIAVYILQELKFNYVWFTLLTISQSVFVLVFLKFWGKVGDRFGNRIIIYICGILISAVPILWMLSTSKVYLLLVPGIIGGFAWGGLNLASVNFIYDAVTQEHRGLASTYYHLFLGAGMFVGPLIGGVIIKYANINFMNIFLFVFLISGIARITTAILFLPWIKEVRRVKKPPLLIKEINILQSFEHTFNGLSKSMIERLHLPNIKSKKLEQASRAFIDKK